MSMRSYISLIAAVILAVLSQQSVAARGIMDKKRNQDVVRIDRDRVMAPDTSSVQKAKLPAHISVYKGEKMTGAAFLYASLNSANSQLFLLANHLSAQGQICRVSPFFSYAYHNNCSVGARFAYTRLMGDVNSGNLSILSDDLKFDVADVSLDYSIYRAGIFHRNYIGLDRRGTVGLFLECQLAYSYNRSTFGKDAGSYSDGHSVDLLLSPGIVLYILPMVSVEASLGIADLGYTTSRTRKDGLVTGSREKYNAAVNLDILNLNFGISYHF